MDFGPSDSFSLKYTCIMWLGYFSMIMRVLHSSYCAGITNHDLYMFSSLKV